MRERSAPPEALAETRFALARALSDSGGDRARARALATRAREALRPLAERWGAQYSRALAQIDDWLKIR
jgi:hypothetical protein